MSARSALIVFSHLRWDFVFQRPQHLLSRFSRDRQVVFIEEPIIDETGSPHWETTRPFAQVSVHRPHLIGGPGGFGEENRARLEPMIRSLLATEQPGEHVAWFYTPMALPLLGTLQPRAVVYDCMDELSAFLYAPRELLDFEEALLRRADVVFTGGPSLFNAKRNRNAHVHCFPSSVESAHFAQALDPSIEAADQAALPRPRFGFFGVIDERLDPALLDAIAVAHPEWQICMVGPVVKIDPATLPRHPNITYFGPRNYKELPGYLAGWDVCLLPFAQNAATRFISPTKTVEYMAAERPIVSTPIRDVADPYGDIVYLGDTPAAFIEACETALHAPAADRQRRVERMREVLAGTSWNATASRMDELIEGAIARRRGQPVPAAEPALRSLARSEVVIVGAGPTGLSAAHHLGDRALLIDANDRVGGWCRSIEVNGFTFDYAGHIMFSNDPYVHRLYKMLLGDNVHWQDREAWIYSKGVHTRYPFQGALYGLPPEVIKECIVGAIEARFGPLKGCAPASDNVSAKPIEDCCADGVAESAVPLASSGVAPKNFEEFIYQVWGAGIARHFAVPYNKKLWAVPLAEMETSWLGGRVPMPDIGEMIDYAVRPIAKPMGPNARFGYPLRGGFQALMDGFLPHLKGRLRTGTRVVAVHPLDHRVDLDDGTSVEYEQLISTMPLPVLVRSCGAAVPQDVRDAAAGLRSVSVRCVHLGIDREAVTDKHWIYYPEDPVFHRIFVQGNASPHCNPKGGFGLTCEITYSPHKPLPCDGDALIQRCIDDCIKVGMITPQDRVIAKAQVDLPHAYVVYDHDRAQNVAVIREWLETHDILLAGRYSEWEYYNSDHAFLAGKKVAETAMVRAPQIDDTRAVVDAVTGSLPGFAGSGGK